jgi:hypothetical protein
MSDDDTRWLPVLDGDKYCAPFCGRGCTSAEHARAVEGASKLVEELGEGWKPRVWENLGWWYEATNGVCAIMPNGYIAINGYTAFLNTDARQYLGRGGTPKEALEDAVKQATMQLNHSIAQVEAL